MTIHIQKKILKTCCAREISLDRQKIIQTNLTDTIHMHTRTPLSLIIKINYSSIAISG